MSQNCDAFYRLRNQRTNEYLPGTAIPATPIHLAVGRTSACTAPGQLALLALANQVVRVHRSATFALPDPHVDLQITTPFGGRNLGEALLNSVNAIDPCGDFSLGSPNAEAVISVAIGHDVANGYDWYIGADRAVAYLSQTPVICQNSIASMRGAALASCLGAAAVFRSTLGRPTMPRSLSAWNYAEGDAAGFGPDTLIPIDVGNTLLVGAGAVASALAYWLNVFGVQGQWTIVDGDVVELHNTNRGLPFTPAHAGWLSGSPVHKVEVLQWLLPSATVYPDWYDKCSELRELTFDVILGLANDRDVRHQLACRNAVVTLQATTGTNWLSQLHRHIVGKDDCLWCRTGEIKTARFGCSTAELESTNGTRADAALPFLSAASGLMLATALQRLQHGDLGEEAYNDWRWDFDSGYRMASNSVHRCKEDCSRIHKPNVRRRINQGQKWCSLDRDTAQ